jgi:hypothetical protein
MVLRYSDRPTLIYNNQTSADSWRERFPTHAKPISTAPERSAQAVIVYEPSGQGHLAMYHSGCWRKLMPQKDFRDGSVRWQMSDQISNPVMWIPVEAWHGFQLTKLVRERMPSAGTASTGVGKRWCER